MAFLTILRTGEARCEQCDSTEYVLHYIVSQDDGDTIRLSICVVCNIVAMDNAMEWNMSRSFAQALANRKAGEEVQAFSKQLKESFDARQLEQDRRPPITIRDTPTEGKGSPLRSDSGHDHGASKKLAPGARRGNR